MELGERGPRPIGITARSDEFYGARGYRRAEVHCLEGRILCKYTFHDGFAPGLAVGAGIEGVILDPAFMATVLPRQRGKPYDLGWHTEFDNQFMWKARRRTF